MKVIKKKIQEFESKSKTSPESNKKLETQNSKESNYRKLRVITIPNDKSNELFIDNIVIPEIKFLVNSKNQKETKALKVKDKKAIIEFIANPLFYFTLDSLLIDINSKHCLKSMIKFAYNSRAVKIQSFIDLLPEDEMIFLFENDDIPEKLSIINEVLGNDSDLQNKNCKHILESINEIHSIVFDKNGRLELTKEASIKSLLSKSPQELRIDEKAYKKSNEKIFIREFNKKRNFLSPCLRSVS